MYECDSDDEKSRYVYWRGRAIRILMLRAERSSAHITVDSPFPTLIPERTKMLHLLGG